MKNTQFNFDFISRSKTFWLISVGAVAVGLIFLISFGVDVGIGFTGGAKLDYVYTEVYGADVSETDVSEADVSAADVSETDISGSYDTSLADVSPDSVSGDLSWVEPTNSTEINPSDISAIVERISGRSAEVELADRIEGEKLLSIGLAGHEAISQDDVQAITRAIAAKYPALSFSEPTVTSRGPSVGKEFFLKCLVAVLVAAALMIVYVGFRFKKIGGYRAGASAVIAVVHDCVMVFFAFVIFRFPIDDNFIAVILTIIGYSMNATIIIFDRIRENRRLLGPKAGFAQIANDSINGTMGRTVNTSLCTGLAVLSVVIISVVYGLESITAFALPMLVGILVGCYSSVCLSGPIWVAWEEKSAEKKRLAAKK